MVFYIEKIKIELSENIHGIHLTTEFQNYPLPGQTIEETIKTVTQNFKIVHDHFSKSAKDKIDADDFNEVCLRIVLYYFYLHNSWRTTNSKFEKIDLTFQTKYYSHPNTYDILIQFFKNRNPNEYIEKCSTILDVTIEYLKKYEYDRDYFYNLFR
ncbi:MAG: hypothetical protein JNK69_09935 [Saprospiraceae bacterium]|nr:hypothetical protein [Candidatus Vicinibacter proximus]MBL7823718.1 hypothetical protein [Saprospiraceae bacterium]HRG32887.1 hypothetical protein [Saprospiraceae bacterium]